MLSDPCRQSVHHPTRTLVYDRIYKTHVYNIKTHTFLLSVRVCFFYILKYFSWPLFVEKVLLGSFITNNSKRHELCPSVFYI